MTTKVALYCRVSTSTKDQTTENQLRELQSYCDRMEYEVVKVYEDEVSGAKSREKRPAYNQLIKDAFLIYDRWNETPLFHTLIQTPHFLHFLSHFSYENPDRISVSHICCAVVQCGRSVEFAQVSWQL